MNLNLQLTYWVADRWRLDYNPHRPHSALDYQTPTAFAAIKPAAIPSILSVKPLVLKLGEGHSNP